MCNGNVRTITQGQMFELAGMMVKAVPHLAAMPFDTAQSLIGDQPALTALLSTALMPNVGDTRSVTVPVDIDWAKVYKQLGMEAEFNDFFDKKFANAGSDPGIWYVPVIKGVTPNKIVKVLRGLGVNVYTYTDDLDTGVPTNDRDPSKGSYVVGFKKNIEADPENANQSANDRKKKKAKDITLLERLLLELGYFLATGNHLDVENVTLCSGSRDSDGCVPDVDWRADDGRLWVGWCHLDRQRSSLRARAVVS